MTNEEIHAVWAPDEAIWSRWAKPVLFAHLPASVATGVVENLPDLRWAPPSDGQTALVLDLPGAMGVVAAVSLARRGYRPVPLYNAVPLPLARHLMPPASAGAIVAVDVSPILDALVQAASELAAVRLPERAPPAFLLDANRSGPGKAMQPDEFDNRSVSFTTDFPSANFFASSGIQRILLVQKDRTEPSDDLAHSLRRWQEGGLMLERVRQEPYSAPEPFQVPRPAWYRAMFQRALVGFGLRRAHGGGFGAWVPDSSSSG